MSRRRAGLGHLRPAEIKTRVKQSNGKRYVFAYNATNAAVTASFSLSSAGSIDVVGESRTLNGFSDTFGPFAAHVYAVP